jgi:hypothetical protein
MTYMPTTTSSQDVQAQHTNVRNQLNTHKVCNTGGTNKRGAGRPGRTWAYVKEYECAAPHASVRRSALSKTCTNQLRLHVCVHVDILCQQGAPLALLLSCRIGSAQAGVTF